MVIVILGILAAVALPKFANFSSSAREAALDNIAGTMQSTVDLVKAHAYVQGLAPASSNPAQSLGQNNVQQDYLVEFNGTSSEVDWRNLCPESRSEMGDKLTMVDFINLSESDELTSQVNNQ